MSVSLSDLRSKVQAATQEGRGGTAFVLALTDAVLAVIDSEALNGAASELRPQVLELRATTEKQELQACVTGGTSVGKSVFTTAVAAGGRRVVASNLFPETASSIGVECDETVRQSMLFRLRDLPRRGAPRDASLALAVGDDAVHEAVVKINRDARAEPSKSLSEFRVLVPGSWWPASSEVGCVMLDLPGVSECNFPLLRTEMQRKMSNADFVVLLVSADGLGNTTDRQVLEDLCAMSPAVLRNFARRGVIIVNKADAASLSSSKLVDYVFENVVRKIQFEGAPLQLPRDRIIAVSAENMLAGQRLLLFPDDERAIDAVMRKAFGPRWAHVPRPTGEVLRDLAAQLCERSGLGAFSEALVKYLRGTATRLVAHSRLELLGRFAAVPMAHLTARKASLASTSASASATITRLDSLNRSHEQRRQAITAAVEQARAASLSDVAAWKNQTLAKVRQVAVSSCSGTFPNAAAAGAVVGTAAAEFAKAARAAMVLGKPDFECTLERRLAGAQATSVRQLEETVAAAVAILTGATSLGDLGAAVRCSFAPLPSPDINLNPGELAGRVVSAATRTENFTRQESYLEAVPRTETRYRQVRRERSTRNGTNVWYESEPYQYSWTEQVQRWRTVGDSKSVTEYVINSQQLQSVFAATAASSVEAAAANYTAAVVNTYDTLGKTMAVQGHGRVEALIDRIAEECKRAQKERSWAAAEASKVDETMQLLQQIVALIAEGEGACDASRDDPLDLSSAMYRPLPRAALRLAEPIIPCSPGGAATPTRRAAPAAALLSQQLRAHGSAACACLADDLERASKSVLLLTIIGSVSVGKSTVVNAECGAGMVGTSVLPETAIPSEVVHVDQPCVTIDGKAVPLPLCIVGSTLSGAEVRAQLDATGGRVQLPIDAHVVLGDGIVDAIHEQNAKVREAVVSCQPVPAELMRPSVILASVPSLSNAAPGSFERSLTLCVGDTPGGSEAALLHHLVVPLDRQLGKSDVVALVVDACGIDTEMEGNVFGPLGRWLRQQQQNGGDRALPLVVLVNKSDRFAEADAAAVHARAHRWVCSKLKEILPASRPEQLLPPHRVVCGSALVGLAHSMARSPVGLAPSFVEEHAVALFGECAAPTAADGSSVADALEQLSERHGMRQFHAAVVDVLRGSTPLGALYESFPKRWRELRESGAVPAAADPALLRTAAEFHAEAALC